MREIENFDLRFLWQQHNEHRIVIPELVFLSDVLVFHGLRTLPVILSCLCYLGSWLLLVLPIIRDARLSRIERALIVLTAGAVVGWKGTALALADPFLLQWTLTSFAALGALTCLLYLRKTSKWWPISIVIILAVVATYSSGSGMLIWPVLIGGGFLLKLSKRRETALIIAGAVAIAVYFVGYRFTGSTHLGDLVSHPLYGAGFVAMYLSMPFGGMKSAHFGVYVGGFSLLVALALGWRLLRSRELITPAGITLCGWYCFSLLAALLVTAGRMNAADSTFTAAKATRYLTPVMLTWGAWTVLVLVNAAQRVTTVAALSIAILTLLLIADRKLNWWFQLGTQPFVAEQITELSLENDIFEPALIRNIFPSADFVARYLPELKKARLSIYFAAPEIGKSVPAPTRPDLPTVKSTVTRVVALSSGVEIVGWTKQAGLDRVFLSNERGQVIGAGRHLPRDFPTELLDPAVPASFAWVAFIPERYAQPGRRFRVYVKGTGNEELVETEGRFALANRAN